MADQKVSDLPSLNGADVDPADLLYIVDSSAGSAGSKKITVGQYQLAPVSGGTANGVVYLNGSKVVTTGSALVFDGTNFSTTGTASATKLIPTGGSATGNGMYLPAANTLGWSTSGAETMRLDSSGNLGLGVTPSAWSVIKAIEIGSFRNSIFSDNGSASVGIASGSYYNAGWKYALTGSTVGYYEVAGNAHRWFSAPSGTAGNAISFTQAMTLDASGNLGIGISSPQAVLHVNKATTSTFRLSATNVGIDIQSLDGAGYGLVSTYTNHPLVFSTNATERARITSGGDLLVGTTGNANNYKTHILTTGAGAAIGIFQNNATTPYGINVYYGAASPNNSNANTSFLYCNDLTTLRIQLASNGGVINYQANDSNLSDRREKTDFAPAKSYLDTICAIPVQTFKYIDQTDDAPTLGVVAQDVQAVAPELVMESNWGTEDNPKMRLSIYQTDLQYALMKCIQEQQELIKDLRARVAALESA